MTRVSAGVDDALDHLGARRFLRCFGLALAKGFGLLVSLPELALYDCQALLEIAVWNPTGILHPWRHDESELLRVLRVGPDFDLHAGLLRCHLLEPPRFFRRCELHAEKSTLSILSDFFTGNFL